MKYLQTDNYNKLNIALKTGADLIRRKATFGTELSDQARELARILIGLQDSFEMKEFQEMRQAALIALVASAPENVAPYLIDVYFASDLSLQQRLILLSALGVGARELAGLEKSVESLLSTLIVGNYTTAITTTCITSTIYFSYGSALSAFRIDYD